MTWRGVAPWRAISSSVSRIWPSRRTWATSSASSCDIRLVPDTRPMAYAGALAFSTVSSAPTTTALLRSTDSTEATPSGTAGSSTSGTHALLALADVPREDAATRHERSDERREEGLRGRVHVTIVRSGSPAPASRDGLSTSVHRAFTA